MRYQSSVFSGDDAMSFVFDDFAASVKAGAPITARDTLALRQWSWADGKITENEANALFELNNIGRSNAPEWVGCFVEALTDFIVNSKEPKGYVDDDNADWLMAHINKDGRVESLGELELLVKILEKATNAPQSLKDYALEQIEQIVLTGVGPTRDGGQLHPGTVDEAEVKLLRRLVYAQAGDGPASVSRAEADMLFRIKDATLLHNNAPEWKTLFVQAVGNHLMAHSSYIPFSREQAAAHEAFMNDNKASIGGFFSRMMRADLGGGFKALHTGDAPVDHDADVEADRAITKLEAQWLNAKLDADSTLDPLEKALLAFIADESGRQPL
jgi:hypothetical protein